MNISYIEKIAGKFSGSKIHVSILLDKKKIVAVGFNQANLTHPLAKKYRYRFDSIHSELHVILRCPIRIDRIREKEYTLINLRFLSNGSMSLAKPCNICTRLLNDFGIKKIYYTDKVGKIVKL